jgi:hypothetical protein
MPTRIFNFQSILKTLVEHEAAFIVIGGVGASLQGAPLVTFDLDVVHDRSPDNLPRLLSALEELDTIYRDLGDRRIRPTLSYLASPGHQLLITREGPLDLLGTVSGDRGYVELLPHSRYIRLEDDLQVRVLDLETLIILKEETGRDKDKAVLPILRRTLEEKRHQ